MIRMHRILKRIKISHFKEKYSTVNSYTLWKEIILLQSALIRNKKFFLIDNFKEYGSERKKLK